MITLKTGEAISSICDVKNSIEALFVENKDWTKAEIG